MWFEPGTLTQMHLLNGNGNDGPVSLWIFRVVCLSWNQCLDHGIDHDRWLTSIRDLDQCLQPNDQDNVRQRLRVTNRWAGQCVLLNRNRTDASLDHEMVVDVQSDCRRYRRFSVDQYAHARSEFQHFRWIDIWNWRGEEIRMGFFLS